MEADTSLVDLFLSLIKIDAVSGSEKPVADFICDYVRNLGFEAHVDDAHVLSGGNTGNVVIPVLGGGDFLLMAHMDTPRSTKGVNPLLLEDRITSDHTTILGVDDRGGISSILWALRYAVEHSMPLKPCTLLFTVCVRMLKETLFPGGRLCWCRYGSSEGRYCWRAESSANMWVRYTRR